jgi:hypothetical protein
MQSVRPIGSQGEKVVTGGGPYLLELGRVPHDAGTGDQTNDRCLCRPVREFVHLCDGLGKANCRSRRRLARRTAYPVELLYPRLDVEIVLGDAVVVQALRRPDRSA